MRVCAFVRACVRARARACVAAQGLVLSKEVMLKGPYKLLVSQPAFQSQQFGWKQPDNTWRDPFPNETQQCMYKDAAPDAG